MEGRFLIFLFLAFLFFPFLSCSSQIISSCEDLQNIQNDLNGTYVIMKDIDCFETVNWNNGKGFKPIGNKSLPFTGSLYGGGTILNLYINRPYEDYVGLFGYINSSNSFRVNFKDVNITGQNYVGSFAGAFFNPTNSISSLVVSSSGVVIGAGKPAIGSGYPGEGGGTKVGGIIGHISGLRDYYTTITYTGTSSCKVIVKPCFVCKSESVGGIFGYSSNVHLRNVRFFGEVIYVRSSYQTSSSSSFYSSSFYVGGLVGFAFKNKITSSYSISNISGGDRVGGLAGYASQTDIRESYFIGNISGGSAVGGLVGYFPGVYSGLVTLIENSYSYANISGGNKINSLVGFRTLSYIKNSYAYGNYFRDSQVFFIGLTGAEAIFVSSITNSYWDAEFAGLDGISQSVYARTTSEMHSLENYVGWDFEKIWGWNTSFNNGYPCLQWQSSCPSPSSSVIAPFCGDGICNLSLGENCLTCVEDCACINDEVCNDEGFCVKQSPIISTPDPILKWFNPFGQLITSPSYSCSLEYNTCNLTLEVSQIEDKNSGEECSIEIYEQGTFLSTKIKTLTSTINEGICNATWDFFEISKDSGFSKKYFFKYEDKKSNDLILIVNSTLNIVNIASCGDYTTKISCEDDLEDVAKYSVGNRTSLCGKTVGDTLYSCYCSWNQSNSICQGTFTSFQFDDDSTPLSLGSCLYKYETDDTCEDGFLLNNIKTSFNWSSSTVDLTLSDYLDCLSENNKQTIIPCPSSIKVPFFSYLQILIVLGLVFVFCRKFNYN